MRKFWISEDGQSGNGIKGLAPTLCTYHERRDGSSVTQYAGPGPSEKWGPWVEHHSPGESDGQPCGSGGFHFWLHMSTQYAPNGAYPWWVQWERPLGTDNSKVRATRYRMRPIHPKVLARFLRLGAGESCYLQGANLQGVNLQGVNLQGANLQGVNLQGANLQGVNLQGADLQGVNLQGANLQGVNLQGADLWRADLREANLRGADLQGADLRDIAHNQDTIWPEGFSLTS